MFLLPFPDILSPTSPPPPFFNLMETNTHLCVETNILLLETNIHLLETNTDMCVDIASVLVVVCLITRQLKLLLYYYFILTMLFFFLQGRESCPSHLRSCVMIGGQMWLGSLDMRDCGSGVENSGGEGDREYTDVVKNRIKYLR